MRRLLHLFVFTCILSSAQSQQYKWLNHAEFTEGFIERPKLKTDPDDNLIASGKFGGNLVVDQDTLVGPGGQAYYITKFDPLGHHLWSKWFTLGGGFMSDLGVDGNGYIYISVTQNTNLTYTDADTTLAAPAGNWIVSFTKEGAFRWVSSVGASDILPVGTSLRSSGFYVASYGMVKHYDSQGVLIWSTAFTSGLSYFNGIETNNNNRIALTARTVTDGVLVLDTVSVNSYISSNDQLIVEMDTSGRVIWMENIPYASTDPYNIVPVAIDAGGRVYVVFDSGTNLSSFVFAGDTLSNPFGSGINFGAVLNFTSEGEPNWSGGTFYSPGHTKYHDIALSGIKEVVLAGTYQGTAYVDNSPLTSSIGSLTHIVARLSNNGDVLWTKQDPRIAYAYYDEANAVVAHQNGTYSVAGLITGPDGPFYAGCHFSFEPAHGGFYLFNIEEGTDTLPVAAFSYTGDGFTYTFSDQSENATSWHWDFGNGITSDEPSPTYTYPAGGTYTVTLTVSFGNCYTSVSEQLVNVAVGQADREPGLSIYPNPAREELFVQVFQTKQSLSVIDLTGKEMIAGLFEISPGIVPLDVAGLPAGMYYLLARDANHVISVMKWVKL